MRWRIMRTWTSWDRAVIMSVPFCSDGRCLVRVNCVQVLWLSRLTTSHFVCTGPGTIAQSARAVLLIYLVDFWLFEQLLISQQYFNTRENTKNTFDGPELAQWLTHRAGNTETVFGDRLLTIHRRIQTVGVHRQIIARFTCRTRFGQK